MVDPHAFMDALREFHHSRGEDLKVQNNGDYSNVEYIRVFFCFFFERIRED